MMEKIFASLANLEVKDTEEVKVFQPDGSPKHVVIKGNVLPQFMTYKIWKDTQAMNLRSTDVCVCTYPKAGTTFTQQICAQLLFDDYRDDKDNQKLYLRSPYVDMIGPEPLEDLPDPRLLKSHLNFDHIPKNESAKYILVVRNPKDAVVSYYFHCVHFKDLYFWDDPNFNRFFELFINGELGYGCYFEHLKSYLAVLSQPNVLLVKYEDLLVNLESEIKRIGLFIGSNAEKVVNDPKMLQQVIDQSRFESMKENQARFIPIEGHGQFVRKGKKRDWKNYLTKEQSDQIDAAFKKHLTGTLAENWWKDEMKWDDVSTDQGA